MLPSWFPLWALLVGPAISLIFLAAISWNALTRDASPTDLAPEVSLPPRPRQQLPWRPSLDPNAGDNIPDSDYLPGRLLRFPVERARATPPVSADDSAPKPLRRSWLRWR